jgi:hypothetical protein
MHRNYPLQCIISGSIHKTIREQSFTSGTLNTLDRLQGIGVRVFDGEARRGPWRVRSRRMVVHMVRGEARRPTRVPRRDS